MGLGTPTDPRIWGRRITVEDSGRGATQNLKGLPVLWLCDRLITTFAQAEELEQVFISYNGERIGNNIAQPYLETLRQKQVWNSNAGRLPTVEIRNRDWDFGVWKNSKRNV